jgi:methylmalonyl-CoA mutase
VIVGVNKYRLGKEPPVAIREVDNTAVREAQLKRLKEVRAKRDAKAVDAALAAITEARSPAGGNLLEPAIRPSARARPSGRSAWRWRGSGAATARAPSAYPGVYGAAFEKDAGWNELQAKSSASRRRRAPPANHGRQARAGRPRPRRERSSRLRSPTSGSTSTSGRSSRRPRNARARRSRTTCTASASRRSPPPQDRGPALIAELRKQGAGDIVVFVGGVIPAQDYAFLEQAGVRGIFGPGTPISDCAKKVLREIRAALRRQARPRRLMR